MTSITNLSWTTKWMTSGDITLKTSQVVLTSSHLNSKISLPELSNIIQMTEWAFPKLKLTHGTMVHFQLTTSFMLKWKEESKQTICKSNKKERSRINKDKEVEVLMMPDTEVSEVMTTMKRNKRFRNSSYKKRSSNTLELKVLKMVSLSTKTQTPLWKLSKIS